PPVWSHVGNQQFGQEGASITAADLNGDEHPDLIVGEPNYNAGGTRVAAGRVLIFYFDANMGVMPSAPDVTLVGAQAGARFGTDTAVGDFNGDGVYDLAIGAPGRRTVAVYSTDDLFDANPAPTWTYTDPQTDSEFGHSLAAVYPLPDGETTYELAVGAPTAQDGNDDETGAVYFFFTDFAGLPSTPSMVRYGPPDSRFGHALAFGDVNGDASYVDLVIGAPETTIDFAREGAVYVYYLEADPADIAATPDVSYAGGQEDALFGYAVAVKDFNQDSYFDVLVGAPDYPGLDGEAYGAAFLFYGTAADLPQTARATSAVVSDWAAYGSGLESQFGVAVTAVDFDQDGRPDIVVGADKQDHGFLASEAGAVFFYFNDGSTINNTYHWKLIGRNADAGFGSSLAAADYNQDNGGAPDDLVVGAPTDSTDAIGQSGAVYYFPGLSLANSIFDLRLNGPTNTAVGQSTPFSATVLTGDNILYEWDFGDGQPMATTYSPDNSPSLVDHTYTNSGQYLLTLRALQPQPYNIEVVSRTIGVGFDINLLTLASSTPTRFGNDTQFRVAVQSVGALSLTLDFGNGTSQSFDLAPGSNILRLSHNYDKPGYYKVVAQAQNSANVETKEIRVRVVRAVSALDGGQIRHEWGGDPERVFLVDVEPDAVDENYELHFNPVGDATFGNPFPDNPVLSQLAADSWDTADDLTPLNIPIFFDLETYDPLSANCLFLPLITGNGSGSGSGTAGLPPCLVEGTAVDSFNEPLVLTLNYKDEDIPDGVNEEDLAFYYYDLELNEWVDGANTCPGGSTYTHDVVNNIVTLPICHQSRWALGG
ncbi:MAG: FG-GAP repeat protein, partial [Anaerolineales bacterium]|nr:FG-GAP repeat protein [Anaerolineales bacterium]